MRLGGGESAAIIGVIGWSGSGKTVLLEKLIAELSGRGYRIGTVKHSMHQGIEFDAPGSDTWRHAEAGSIVSVLAAPGRLASFARRSDDPSLEEALSLITGVDLVLVEGYKSAPIPQVVVVGESGPSLAESRGPYLVAIVVAGAATDDLASCSVPAFDREEIRELADLIEGNFLRQQGNFA